MKCPILVACVFVLLLPIATQANPIPLPVLGRITEQIQIRITHGDNGLHAEYLGEFCFAPSSVVDWHQPEKILFPLPPTATNIAVRLGETDLDWHWTEEDYPTVLPEWPTIPMLEWDWPTTATTEVFSVHYEHDLIDREDESVFFYAMGVWKFYADYYEGDEDFYYDDRSVNFEIDFPDDMVIAWVHADDQPSAYGVIGSQARINAESRYLPMNMDLIISLKPKPQDFRIVGVSPASSGIIYRRTPQVDPIVLTFSRELGPLSATTDSLSLLLCRYDEAFGPSAWEIPIASVQALTTNTLQFTPAVALSYGCCQVQLEGDAIQDVDGHLLDAEFDGEYPTGDGTPGGDYSCSFRIMDIWSFATAAQWIDYE